MYQELPEPGSLVLGLVFRHRDYSRFNNRLNGKQY